MDEKIVIFITTPSKGSAEKLCDIILNKKLAACVSIVESVKSKFWWRGNIDSATEYLLIAKTFSRLFNDIVKEVTSNHEYEVPEIIALPVPYASGPYSDWMSENIKK